MYSVDFEEALIDAQEDFLDQIGWPESYMDDACDFQDLFRAGEPL